jgi:hypothetical protein
MNQFHPSIHRISALKNLFDRLIESIRKTMLSLHEDLQYDFGLELEELMKHETR